MWKHKFSATVTQIPMTFLNVHPQYYFIFLFQKCYHAWYSAYGLQINIRLYSSIYMSNQGVRMYLTHLSNKHMQMCVHEY